MGRIAAELADRVIVTSDNPRSEEPSAIAEEVAAGARSAGREALVVLDRREAIVQALGLAAAGDVVVLAGKGHETDPGHGRAGRSRSTTGSSPERRSRSWRGRGGSEEVSLSLGPDLPEVSRAAVFGLAKSGLATIRALLSRDVTVVATDAAPAEKLGAFPADERLELVLGGHPASLLRASTSASSRPACRCRSRCSTRRGHPAFP